MSSIIGFRVLALSSPTKFHHLRQNPPILTPTHFSNPNEFPIHRKNPFTFVPKLTQSINFTSPISHLPLKPDFIKKLAISLLLGFFYYSTKPALALSPTPPPVITSQSDLEEESMFEKVLENEPDNKETMKVLLYKKMRRGKSDEAVKYVEKLMRLEPNEVEWKLLEAFCYETMGELSKAKRLFKRILKDKPLLSRALHGLAMVMHKTHDPSLFDTLKKAMEIAKRKKRVTEERNIQILIGQMHIVKGQFEEGLKIFQQMVKDNPRDFRPYLCQGIAYSLMDKKEEADKQFEIYWSLVPEEYSQKCFLDDVAIAAQAKSRERLQNTLKSKFRG